MKKLFFLALILVVGAIGFSQREPLAPNDVSILMPLPQSMEDMSAHLYLASADGIWPTEHNRTIIKQLFSTVPGSVDVVASQMLVTAFRFDPCFPQLNFENPQNCEAQIRLTAQYYAPSSSGLPEYDEVALHLFYRIAPEQVTSVVADLRRLKAESPVSTANQPLFVHPALASQGMNSAWGRKLKATILKYVNEQNLIRVTGTGFVFDAWPFFAYQVRDGRLQAETLAHTTNPGERQTWNIFAEPPLLGNVDVAPATELGANFFTSVLNLNDDAQVRSSIDSLARIQNPQLHNPHSVDCVSCHTAQMATQNALSQNLNISSAFSYSPPAEQNASNLTDSRIRGTSANVVQFGYFLRRSPNHGLPDGRPLPSVSDRVIFESIEAARFIDRR